MRAWKFEIYLLKFNKRENIKSHNKIFDPHKKIFNPVHCTEPSKNREKICFVILV